MPVRKPQRVDSWGSPSARPCAKPSEQDPSILTPQEWIWWPHPWRSAVPEKELFLTHFLSSSSSSELFPQASWVFRGVFHIPQGYHSSAVLASEFAGNSCPSCREHSPKCGGSNVFSQWGGCALCIPPALWTFLSPQALNPCCQGHDLSLWQ